MESIKVEKLSNNKLNSINLAELKHFLRIDGKQDDSLLVEMLKVAESELERGTAETLMVSDWSIQVLNYSGNFLDMNRKNIRNISQVMIMHAGKMKELKREFYTYSKGILNFHHVICTKVMRIVFRAGHTKAEAINPELLSALKQRVACIYENKACNFDPFGRFREIRI